MIWVTLVFSIQKHIWQTASFRVSGVCVCHAHSISLRPSSVRNEIQESPVLEDARGWESISVSDFLVAARSVALPGLAEIVM